MSVSETRITCDPTAASATDLWLEQLAEQHDIEDPDPRRWLPWVDEHRWTIGNGDGFLLEARHEEEADNDDQGDEEPLPTPPPAEEPGFEPSEIDRQWLAPLDLADDGESWEALRRWAERMDAMSGGRITSSPLSDDDVAIATGCC
jgi:hypothetical protein